MFIKKMKRASVTKRQIKTRFFTTFFIRVIRPTQSANKETVDKKDINIIKVSIYIYSLICFRYNNQLEITQLYKNLAGRIFSLFSIALEIIAKSAIKKLVFVFSILFWRSCFIYVCICTFDKNLLQNSLVIRGFGLLSL